MQLNKLNKRYIQLDIVRRNMETDINLGRYKTDIMCELHKRIQEETNRYINTL